MVFEMGKYYKHTSGKKLHIIGRVEDSYLYGDGLVGEEPDYYNFLPIGDDECSATNWHEITYSEWFNDGEQVGNVAKPDACPQLCEGWRDRSDKSYYNEKRILIFTPCYEDITMRWRIIDSQFMDLCTEASHWKKLDEPAFV